MKKILFILFLFLVSGSAFAVTGNVSIEGILGVTGVQYFGGATNSNGGVTTTTGDLGLSATGANIKITSNKNLTMEGSGTFTSGTGEVTLNSDTTVNGTFRDYISNALLTPQVTIEQAGTGDTSIHLYHSAATAQSATIGLDQSDNKNIKISNSSGLTSVAYPDPNTMMRIHTETNSEGIIDFDNQSKVRAWRSAALDNITDVTETKIAFDSESYDIKNEFNTGTGTFTAKEAGYYMVTATSGVTGAGANASFLRLTIRKDGAAYSVGPTLSHRAANCGAIVNDIVPLAAGGTIEIYIFLSVGANTYDLRTGQTVTYVSIHKIS